MSSVPPSPRAANPLGRPAWGAMFLLAALVSAYAVCALFVPTIRSPIIQGRLLTLPLALGGAYVASVIVGGAAALVLATQSIGGLVTPVGFALLAALWITSTLIAFRHVRTGRLERHRAWMLRSYALTLAAVTLRIDLPLSLAAGLPYEPSYQAIAWLCWVPNLVVVERVVLRPRHA